MKTEKSSLQTENELQDTSSVRHQLIQSFKTSKDYRNGFVEEQIRACITSQIRAIREKTNGMNQENFGAMLGKSQSWVARLEDPDEALPTLSTLLEVAKALDVNLVVRFGPFSELADWMSGTPHLVPGLSQKTLSVESFSEEEDKGFADSVSFVGDVLNPADLEGACKIVLLMQDEPTVVISHIDRATQRSYLVPIETQDNPKENFEMPKQYYKMVADL